MVKWTTASYTVVSAVWKFIFSLFSLSAVIKIPLLHLFKTSVVSLHLNCIFTIYHNNPWKCTFNRRERGHRYVTPSHAHSTRLFPLCNWQIHGKQPQIAEVNCVLRMGTMTNYKPASLWPLCIRARLSLVISSRTRAHQKALKTSRQSYMPRRTSHIHIYSDPSCHAFSLWFI